MEPISRRGFISSKLLNKLMAKKTIKKDKPMEEVEVEQVAQAGKPLNTVIMPDGTMKKLTDKQLKELKKK